MLYDKSVVKGGERSRAVPVNRDSGRAIDNLIVWHREWYNTLHKSCSLFPSRQGTRPQPMSRRTAHDVLKATFEAAGLNGHLATHSLRKNFAQRPYDRTAPATSSSSKRCWGIATSRPPRNTWGSITPPFGKPSRK